MAKRKKAEDDTVLLMDRRRYDFILEASEPIAHAEETVGNVQVAMRRKVRQPDGSFARVPVVTGDTMRHGLREAAAYAYLDAADLLGRTLSESALRLLFSGGMVTGSSGGSVKLGDYYEMCDLFPPLALLGGCAQNRVVPGKMQVSDAILLCSEQDHLLPPWVSEWMTERGSAVTSCRAHVEETQRVRMDPSLDPSKRLLLTEASSAAVQGRMTKSEKASAGDDHGGKDAAKSSMMPFRYERLVAGSLFYWSVTATCHSELDVDTFHVMCGAFLSSARVGGKKGTGHGLLRPVTGRHVHVARPADNIDAIQPEALAPRMGEVFRAHVKERADKARSWLEVVAA